MNKPDAVILLGGGQLARMLIDAFDRLRSTHARFPKDIKLILVTEDDRSSASKRLREWILPRSSDRPTDLPYTLFVGDLSRNESDRTAFKNLLANLGVKRALLTAESEWAYTPEVGALFPSPAFEFAPNASALETFRNKVNQKRVLNELKIPTPAHRAWDSTEQALESWIEECFQSFDRGLVFKWAIGGYDGKGTLILPPTRTPREPGDLKRVFDFCAQAREKGCPLFCEAYVPFTQELALVGARSEKDRYVYPLALTRQRQGICMDVKGPARAFGVPESVQAQAQEAFDRLTSAVDYVGTLAIEFFFSPEYGLQVNEIAPRVHNSGHHTLASYSLNQFDLHWLAILGLELGPPIPNKPLFGMKNVIGTLDVSKLGRDPHFYDYEKDAREGRKRGHVHFTGESPDEINARFEEYAWLENPKNP